MRQYYAFAAAVVGRFVYNVKIKFCVCSLRVCVCVCVSLCLSVCAVNISKICMCQRIETNCFVRHFGCTAFAWSLCQLSGKVSGFMFCKAPAACITNCMCPYGNHFGEKKQHSHTTTKHHRLKHLPSATPILHVPLHICHLFGRSPFTWKGLLFWFCHTKAKINELQQTANSTTRLKQRKKNKKFSKKVKLY